MYRECINIASVCGIFILQKPAWSAGIVDYIQSYELVLYILVKV